MLSGLTIKKEVKAGRIHIDDFDDSRLNPNSYNLRLHDQLLVYTSFPLDMKKPNKFKTIDIPDDGLLLEPHTLYLGRTVERTSTDYYVPCLDGRSSGGRLGINVHATAGFGDVGFCGFWTLEITCTHPTIVYPFVDICQIYYEEIEGEYELYNSAKYQNNTGIQPSLMFLDFQK